MIRYSVGVFVVLAVISVSGIQFDLAPTGYKCLSEELPKNTRIQGRYQFRESPRFRGDIQVKGPDGAILFSEVNRIEGVFELTTNEGGQYDICFSNMALEDQVIMVEIKTGMEAQDYSQLAKSENLDLMDLSIRKVLDSVKNIKEELLYFKDRESAMRDTNESTNARVLWFSMGSVFILVSLGIWQIFYLKRFFRAKKLI